MRRLPDLQRDLFRAIAGSRATVGPPPVLDEIQGNARLSPAERLAVYARMYRARLVDVLTEDYPRVGALLGAEAFGAAAHAYIDAHPSTQPSLRWFGARFAEFLDQAPLDGAPEFLVDLARLEWARLAVFDAPDAPLLEIDALRRIPPDEWTTLRLSLVPAVVTLDAAWPVHEIWQAVETALPSSEIRPSTTHLRVWRQGDQVFQVSMDAAERIALAAVVTGDTFADLCERLASVVSAEEAPATAGSLMLRWLEDGVLAALPDR
ncbi:MAG: DNA-binding domain-containing protein [Candidatus Binatia bacterium]